MALHNTIDAIVSRLRGTRLGYFSIDDVLLKREAAATLAARTTSDGAYGILRTANPPLAANDCVPLAYFAARGTDGLVLTPPVQADFDLIRTTASTLTWFARGAVLRSDPHSPGTVDLQYAQRPWPVGNVYYMRHTWSGKASIQYGIGGVILSKDVLGVRQSLVYMWYGRELGLREHAYSLYSGDATRTLYAGLGDFGGAYGAPQPFVRVEVSGTVATFSESLTGWPGTYVDAFTIDLATTSLAGVPDHIGWFQDNQNNSGTADAPRWDIAFQVDHADINPPTLAP